MSVNGTTATSDSLPITSDLRPGAIALGTIATISTICSGSLLITLLVGAFTSRKSERSNKRVFLRTHVGALVFCLILTDLIQSVCGMLTFVWVRNGQVATGTLCTVQAVFLHIDNVGTAFWNAAIAGHTFWTVVLRKRSSTLGIACLIVAGWTICGLLPVIGRFVMQTKEGGPFYTIAGIWCFIPNSYPLGRLVLHYLLLLISASIIAILYIQVALVLFGILIIEGGTWRFKAPTGIRSIFRQFSWDRINRPSSAAADQSIDPSTDVSDGSLDRGGKNKPKSVGKKSNTPELSVFDGGSSRPAPLKKLGIKMLWYPTGYFVLILPLTIYRLNPHLNTNLGMLLAFTCLFLFMGTVNTIIYIYTRQIIGQSPWSRFVSYTCSKITGATLTTNAGISIQVRTQRATTQPVPDDQFIELGHRKSPGGLTETSSISSIPVVTSDGDDDFPRRSKVGFDFTGGKATRHVLPTNSVGLTGAPDHLAAYPGYQEPASQHPLSSPRSLMRRQEKAKSEEIYPGHLPSFIP